MAERKMGIVRIPASADGRKRSWRKHLTAIDPTKKFGYAYLGPWVYGGQLEELPIGSHVLAYDQPGSRANWYSLVRLFRVMEADEGATLELVYEWESEVSDRKSWALACRDDIAEILDLATAGSEPEAAPSAVYPPEILRLIEMAGDLAAHAISGTAGPEVEALGRDVMRLLDGEVRARVGTTNLKANAETPGVAT